MTLEQKVCELVKKYWRALHSKKPVPNSLVFIKVAGKTSPNASIIAMILDAHRRCPVAVAKIPRNPQVVTGLELEYEAMVDLRESISDTRILNHTIYRGTLVETDGLKILLQAAGVGHPMVGEMTSRKSVEALYEQILPWMFEFHADGAEKCNLEGKILNELVETPIARFMEQFGEISSTILSNEARQHLAELPRKVEGQKIRLCRQHGDFNAHNTLVEFKRGRLVNFTLIDWEDYRSRQLPIHDLNHFFTSNSHLLGAGMSPVESYSRFVLSDGWYRALYVKAVKDYTSNGLIDKNTFWTLTPLYMIEMCFCVSDIQRYQPDTASTWIKRMDAFISNHLRNTQ